MTLTALLAIACIVVAVIGEVVDERLLFSSLEWLVAAIALNTLGVGFYTFGKRGQP